MSFIDSQKFSPIHSIIDDHSLEAEQANQVFNLLDQTPVNKLISLQDEFEPSSALEKDIKLGFKTKQKIDAKEMLEILKRLETETPEQKPKIKVKQGKLTQKQITALQKQASQQAMILTNKAQEKVVDELIGATKTMPGSALRTQQ